MPVLEQLVEDNAAISDRAAAEFLSNFGDIEDELERRLLKLIKRLPTKNGVYVWDDASAAILQQVRKVLRDIMSEEKLKTTVRELLPEFDRIAENVAMMHGEENDIKVAKALVNDRKKRMIDLTTENVIAEHYDARFVEPVKKALYFHVTNGAEVLEVERVIKVLTHGQGDKSSTLTTNLGTVARDALNQYEGQVHKAVALAYDLHNYRYIGNILPGHKATKGKNKGKMVGGSRPQCRRWVEKGIITQEELPKEIRWMFKYGTGWIAGTTAAIWPIVRGGYGCLHTALPTRREP